MNYQDFMSLSEQKKEIRHKVENVNGEDIHIFHYMIATLDLFKTEIERECRGITFDSKGQCICRPFHKFFNIGEREETLPQNIDWNSIQYVSNKIDGSLVCPVIINDKVFWKTKKSFYSEIAVKLQKAWDNKEAWIYRWNNDIWDHWLVNETMLFEYTSTNNRIVTDYGKENDLVFLGSRHILSGVYHINKVNCNSYYSDFLKEKEDAYKYFIENIKETPLIEGYVLYDDKNNAYKLKTQWYLDRHHLFSTLSYREIIKMIQEERIDDVISELRLKGCEKQVVLIEQVIDNYSRIRQRIFDDCERIFSEITYDKKLDKGKLKEVMVFLQEDIKKTDIFYKEGLDVIEYNSKYIRAIFNAFRVACIKESIIEWIEWWLYESSNKVILDNKVSVDLTKIDDFIEWVVKEAENAA